MNPYNIPNTDIIIEKGCKVTIPHYAIHHDSQYYPDPFTFDPDRFLEENVKSRPAYTYMPFGDGPRICIGKKPVTITSQQNHNISGPNIKNCSSFNSYVYSDLI